MYQETKSVYSVNSNNDIRSFLGFPSDYPLHKIVEYIIVYLRKSRKDEELYGDEAIEETLARHLKTLQEWAIATFGVKLLEKNIKKEVVSGETIEGRPIIREVLNTIESDQYRAVLCIDVQRLGRGDLEDQGRLVKCLMYSNTKVLTPSHFYDLNNKYDKKFFEQKMRESADFLEYVKDKMGDGRIRSVLDRTYPHSSAPYGFERVKIEGRKGYTLVQRQDECYVCKLAVDILKNGLDIEYEVQEGDSYLSIARTFGITKSKLLEVNQNCDFKVHNKIKIKETNSGTSIISNYFNYLNIKPRKASLWTPAMIRNILLSKAAHGYVTWGSRKTVKTMKNGKIIKNRPHNQDAIVIKGGWDPIYSEEDSIIIKNALNKKRVTVQKNNEIRNPLVGLVRCDLCKSKMQRRPYYEKQNKVYKRVYEVDKKSLQKFLRDRKDELNLSITDISRSAHISRSVISRCFAPSLDRFVLPKPKYWEQIKTALRLKETIFDEPLTLVKEKSTTHVDTLLCNHKNCKNIGCDLQLVEERLIDALQQKLSEYKTYSLNYAKVVETEIKTNTLTMDIIQSEIEKVNKKLEKICDFLEDGTYSHQLFNERKEKLDRELLELEKKKKQLSTSSTTKKYNQQKKMVPILENVLNKYHSNLSAENKNKLLSTVVDVIYYRKEKGGRNNKDNFELKVYLKI